MKLKPKLSKYLKGVCEWILNKIVEVDQRILFFSSMPDYSDNSLALSDYIVNNKKQYKIYWSVNNKENIIGDNENITFVENKGLGKLKVIYIGLKASWLFGTHGFPFVCKYEERRKKQKYIRLWHGCSYKDKGIKDKGNLPPSFDLALVAGPLFVETKSYFWNCRKNQIISLGYPRYDWLLMHDDFATKLYNEFSMGVNKVIMWMPTYRSDKNGIYNDTNNITSFPLFSNSSEWLDFDKYCHEIKAVILVKLHPFQKDYDIPWNEMSNVRQVDNSTFKHCKMYLFLAQTDALISDYSSVAVDYIIVDKPIAFTLDDFEVYKDGRGFVVPNPKDYMPGHHLYNIADLCGFVRDVVEIKDPYKKMRNSLRSTIVSDSHHYCKDIVEYLGL